MGLIDIQERIVTLLHLDELGQIWVVSIHAVNTLDRHHDPLVLGPQVAEQAIELVGVVVTKRPPACLRCAGALHDAVVGQLVVENEIAGTEEVVEHGGIGAIAAGKYHGPLRADECRQFGVKLVEDCVVAADHAAGGSAAAETVDRRLGGTRHVGVACQAEIVEAREAHDITAADPRRPAPDLLVGQQEWIFEPGRLQAGEPLLQRRTLRKFHAFCGVLVCFMDWGR